MQKLSKIALFVGVVSFVPATANAQVTLAHTLAQISGLINGLIPIVLAIAVLLFFWGLAMYMFNANNTEKRSEGINIMFMGIIAIFVMVSLWGIIRILQQTFKVDQAKPIVPEVIQRGYN
ncbi:hypothetical protein CL652_00290 [bacterium]|nr:hypothetical protein [bacterium]|tara:strand:+ start:8685 stop:9044 length:360 start_codon:yes stop_codon:yes gene_type:complete